MPFSSPGQGRKNRFSRPPQRLALSPHVPDTRLCLRRCVRGGGVRLPEGAASTPEAEDPRPVPRGADVGTWADV